MMARSVGSGSRLLPIILTFIGSGMPAFAKRTTPLHIPAFFERVVDGSKTTAFVFRAERLQATVVNGGISFATEGRRTRLRFSGAKGNAELVGEERAAGVSNHILGNDAQKWRYGVPHFDRVKQREIYPGIDVVYHAAGGDLEYDFVVRPGARPEMIEMTWEGADQVGLDGEGNVVASTGEGKLILKPPLVYQTLRAKRMAVEARYRLSAGNRIRLELGPYEKGHELVIDPAVTLATLFGATDWHDIVEVDAIAGLAADKDGNVYLARTLHFYESLPILGISKNGAIDSEIVIAKLDPSGSRLLSWTVLGGSSTDTVAQMISDSFGNLYICGGTTSSDFPVLNAVQPTKANNAGNGFIAKLAADGQRLQYSTFLGGPGGSSLDGIAVDGSGAVYVTGTTVAPDFPTTAGAFQRSPRGITDVVIAKISPDGSRLVFSTYFGGSGEDISYGHPAIAVDGIGNAYFVVSTTSPDLPVTPDAFRRENTGVDLRNGPFKVFVAKLNVTGTALLFGSYLGSSNVDYPSGVGVDEAGHVYVAGITGDGAAPNDFPVTPGAWLTTAFPMFFGGSATYHWFATVGFATKFNSNASALHYSTFLGERANAVK
ncbi:MAG: hypothetical protein IT167_18020, partial [Bryobacterales bacterium]|nr:hypothetical protein [Bryobacterales bacterium]